MLVRALPGRPFTVGVPLSQTAVNSPATIASEDLCPSGYSGEVILKPGEMSDTQLDNVRSIRRSGVVMVMCCQDRISPEPYTSYFTFIC